MAESASGYTRETSEPLLWALRFLSARTATKFVPLGREHRAIAEQNARDLLAALLALRGSTCQVVWDGASRTAERVVAEGRARNRAYDVETKHGQTQGVELRP